jgi:hypothetical protein
MRDKRKQGLTNAERLEARVPPIASGAEAIEALRRNLLYNLYSRLTSNKADAIADKLMGLAAEGDTKAMRLYFDLLRAGGESQAPSVQHTTVYGHHGNVTIFLSDIRHKLAVVLAREGPRPAEVLAERARLLLPDALQALNHDWFEKEQDVWNVTDKGRREALELKG